MKHFLVLGIVFCVLSVILGAFAAHGLKAVLASAQLAAFKTGVEYQFYHGLALVLLSAVQPQYMASDNKKVLANRAGLFFVLGTVLFSGSLYLLATTGIKIFGPITPLGGLCFIVGWSLMLWAVIRPDSN
ncbi:DUF423 domain-containing protein [Alteromonadaceae bacterium M269]|nr:DUF423 domain-containing protein [Alteromonadaceae bacterium M269]